VAGNHDWQLPPPEFTRPLSASPAQADRYSHRPVRPDGYDPAGFNQVGHTTTPETGPGRTAAIRTAM